MTTVLFSALEERWEDYEKPLMDAFEQAGLTVNLVRRATPEDVDYIIYAPNSGLVDFSPFTRLRGVLSLWAGVETIVDNPTLTVPLTRMVDSGLRDGMVEWVTAHVLRHHLGLDTDICRKTQDWQPRIPPLAKDRKVSILGMGALGTAAAGALKDLNFDVAGWSRRPKTIADIPCLSGTDGLETALARAEILVLLLPLTETTENILDQRALSRLPEGAIIINPGRGPLIDDDALLSALNRGQIAHATLDVFRTEPLPEEHPFWHHENVTVTPHIASATRPATAAEVIAENIRRDQNGQTMRYLVDRDAGY